MGDYVLRRYAEAHFFFFPLLARLDRVFACAHARLIDSCSLRSIRGGGVDALTGGHDARTRIESIATSSIALPGSIPRAQ